MSGRLQDRRGFTLVEMTVVALIISILAALAVPNIKMALLKARAVEVASDLDVMRVAVLSYLAENNQWPPDAPVGVVPTGLDVYLPAGFEFEKERYTLNYDNWTTHSPYFIAVTAETGHDHGLMIGIHPTVSSSQIEHLGEVVGHELAGD